HRRRGWIESRLLDGDRPALGHVLALLLRRCPFDGVKVWPCAGVVAATGIASAITSVGTIRFMADLSSPGVHPSCVVPVRTARRERRAPPRRDRPRLAAGFPARRSPRLRHRSRAARRLPRAVPA